MPGYRAFLILLLFFAFTFQPGGSAIAQPSSEFSGPKVVNEFIEVEFQIYQFEVPSISRFSYMLVSGKQALLVDPVRDVLNYLDHAQRLGVAWVGVLLTHSHTDFVAGHREMALATGAPIYVSHRSEALFPHMQLKEGDQLNIGQVKLEIIETPGHTLDSLLAVVTTSSLPDSQTYVFAGDNFPADGSFQIEPYTHSTSAAELASMHFDSWRDKVSRLTSNTVLLASRYCCWGASSSSANIVTHATIASVKANNPMYSTGNRNVFIAQTLTDDVQLSPRLLSILKFNLQGPPLLAGDEVGDRINEYSVIPGFRNTKIIDVRPRQDYLLGHVKGSISLPLKGRLETVASMIIAASERIILVGDQVQIKEAALRLARIGLKVDHIIWNEYLLARAPLATLSEMDAAELRARLDEKTAPLIVDVRMPAEFRNGRIPNAINIPLSELEQKAPILLSKGEEIVVVCATSYRSGAAMGILRGQGFDFVTHVVNGIDSWRENGYHQTCSISPIRCSQKRFCRQSMPGVISPAELYDLWSNSPEKLELVDIRSKDKIEDYNPFSVAVDDLDRHGMGYGHIDADKIVVIVSDDAAEAMIFAGKLSLTSDNIVRILKGGLGSWWYYSKLKHLNLLHDKNSQLLQFEDEYLKPDDLQSGHPAARGGDNSHNE